MSRRRPTGRAGGIAVVLAGLVLGVSLLTQGPPSGSPGASVPQAQAPTGVTGHAGVAPPHAASAGMGAVAWEDLPAQAHVTYRLILAGGPFPYDRDGTVFFNRERLLPQQARGYYREYTVDTPGLTHRGARRIVCGGEPPTQPQVCYYTNDHYASFRYIQTNQ